MKKSNKRDLLRYLGDPSALYGIKEYYWAEGKARGIRAFDLDNGGGLELTVLADRGLDISHLRFKGINVGCFSKTGLLAPSFFVERGLDGFLKQFFGGFLTTGGIRHAGPPSEENGHEYGLHGSLNNTPAENIRAGECYNGDDISLYLEGAVREARVFGPNLYLQRRLVLETESNRLTIEDVVENRGFVETPIKLLYHINFGYPMLEEGCRVYSNSQEVHPRDREAASGIKEQSQICAPVDGYQEQCFFHVEGDKEAFAMLHNPHKSLAVIIHYDREQCPLLCQWKSMASGDYALGLEPATAGVFNHEEDTRILSGGESFTYKVIVECTDDPEVIQHYIAKATA